MSDFEDKFGFQDVWTWPSRRGGSGGSAGGGRGGSGAALNRVDKARLQRVVGKAPEVMLKVGRPSKMSKDGRRLVATQKGEGVRAGKFLEYIGRNSKVEIETSDGVRITDHAGRRELHAEWQAHHADAIEQGLATDRTRLYHAMVLSMPPGTDPEALYDAARAFAHSQFGGRHDYVLALHTDTEHPHVHLGVRTVGYDGRKFHPDKPTLQHWREDFAGELRKRGIEAEATTRPARGIILKPERQAIRHMEQRGVASRVGGAARAEVARELLQNGELRPRRWEEAITRRRAQVMETYLDAAAELRRSPDAADRRLGDATERFVSEMPRHETRRHRLAEELIPEIDRVMSGRERGGPSPGVNDTPAPRR